MLLGNVRASLTRDAAQLALRLLAHGEAREIDAAEARLREEGIDAILDDPRLLPAIIESRAGMQVSVRLFWYVVVRRATRCWREADAGHPESSRFPPHAGAPRPHRSRAPPHARADEVPAVRHPE